MKKLLSSILVLIIVVCSCVYFVACKDDDTISLPYRIEKYFDLEEEKVYWDGEFADNGKTNCIYIKFKTIRNARLDVDTPIMFPVLCCQDLEYYNAEILVYESSAPSAIDAFIGVYHQSAIVYLKEKGKDKVLEAIDYFSRMSIVYYAGPYPDVPDIY